MCHRRPLARAQFPAPNRTPSAALFLLRRTDNKSSETSIRARTACKSATSLPRRPRAARLPQLACPRRAGTSKEFRPRSSARDGQRGIRRTVEGKSTPAIFLGVSSRPILGPDFLLPVPLSPVFPTPPARKLQSPAAIPPGPFGPVRRPLAQEGPAQSAGSTTEIPKIWAAGGKDPIHLAGANPVKGSANPPKPAGRPCIGFSETSQSAHRSAILPRQRDKRR